MWLLSFLFLSCLLWTFSKAKYKTSSLIQVVPWNLALPINSLLLFKKARSTGTVLIALFGFPNKNMFSYSEMCCNNFGYVSIKDIFFHSVFQEMINNGFYILGSLWEGSSGSLTKIISTEGQQLLPELLMFWSHTCFLPHWKPGVLSR